MGIQTSRVSLDHDIRWYRTSLPPGSSETLHAKSDALGALQTLGFLGMLGAWLWGAQALSSCSPAAAIVCALLYGAQANYLINGMHELGHGSVFKTKILNDVFMRVVSFLGWLHPDMFFSSHLLHHRYTQNAPFDLENPTPIRLSLSSFLAFGFVNVRGAFDALTQTTRAALGVYPTGHLGWLPEWEAYLYKTDPGARRPAMLWAWVLLLGHASIAFACCAQGAPIIPLLISGGPFFNGWIFFLCNATQHVGLAPGKHDFRLNSRTFILNPFLRFWFWHMNYHVEHHMYANVPCYRLADLHAAIKHDLPPTPVGLFAVWREIVDILEKQKVDPDFEPDRKLPPPAAAPSEAAASGVNLLSQKKRA